MSEIKVTVSEKIFEEIKSLTELELLELMQLLPDYLGKEKMYHLVDQVFGPTEELTHEIDELNDRIEEIEDELFDSRKKISGLEKRIADAIEKCEDGIKDNPSTAEVDLLNEIIETLQD